MKHKINFAINVAMLFAILACGVTGVAKFPELNLQLSPGAVDALSLVHDWSGVAIFVLALAHMALHARWFVAAPRALAVRARPSSSPRPSGSTGPRVAKGATAALLMVLLLAVPGLPTAARGRHVSNPTIPQGQRYAPGSLKDGVYTGTATGYMPGLSVEVVVKGGNIASVQVTENYETPRWLRMVQSLIPQRILQAQGTGVDVVSGATSSSLGIMSAVEDALKDAKKS